MNRASATDNGQHDISLILFVTGGAPRSRRARRNLNAVLGTGGLDVAPPHEIDLLDDPQQAITYGIFATPALMQINASGQRRVLYGDLSDEQRLKGFLAAL